MLVFLNHAHLCRKYSLILGNAIALYINDTITVFKFARSI